MTYISEALRREVRERAHGRCEYCLIHERYSMRSHEVDHIYAEKHGGKTVADNLCLSCLDCNRFKGSDLCSLDEETSQIVALFHPHRHVWGEHFVMRNAAIEPLTPTGRVTIRLFRMNENERVAERARLIRLGRYPQTDET